MTTALIIICIVFCIGIVIGIVGHLGVGVAGDKGFRRRMTRHHAAKQGHRNRATT